MKKEVKFDLFGDQTDYLYFGLKELRRATMLTPDKLVGEVIGPLYSGAYDIDFILGLLKIGLTKCWNEKGRKIDDVEQMFESVMDGENVTIMSFAQLLLEALTASGFFGVPAGAVEWITKMLKILQQMAGNPQQ